MESLKMVVPVVPDELLTPKETQTLERLGLDTEYLTELVLCQWDGLQAITDTPAAKARLGWEGADHGIIVDLAYDQVIEAVADCVYVPGQYRTPDNDITLYLAEHAEEVVKAACKVRLALQPYLGDMPMGDVSHPIDAVTVERFASTYTVVEFHFLDTLPEPSCEVVAPRRPASRVVAA